MPRSTTLPAAPGGAPPVTGAGVFDEGVSGMELPEFLPDSTGPQAVDRTFAFLDLCGFTAFTEAEGAKQAVEVLGEFRTCVRQLAARRGVRIAKWLGDGVMLVSTDPGPMVATVSELLARLDHGPLRVRAGVASGECLLFEGDDYIGRPVNLAARLCEAAAPGELLALDLDDDVPEWVRRGGSVTVRAMGIGDVAGVSQLRVDEGAWASVGPSPTHPSLALVASGADASTDDAE